MAGGRHPTPVSERQRARIAKAIASGLPVVHLWQPGRFKGVSFKTMAEIADAARVARQRQTRKAEGRKAP